MASPWETRAGAQGHSRSHRRMGSCQFMTFIGCLAITCSLACYAQQPNPASPKRVGLIEVGSCLSSERWWSDRLAELGWSKGTIALDCVSAVGRMNDLPAVARELVSRRPDVLMAVMTIFVSALKQETTTIPIVMLATWDPVLNGLVTNLARPEGNVTGVTWYGGDKEIELLKDAMPNLRRVAFVGQEVGYPPEVIKRVEERLQIAASALGVTRQAFRPVVPSDYDEIFARIAAEHFDAAQISADGFTFQNATRVIGLALRHRIPTISSSSQLAKNGLLLGYGQDVFWSVRRASEYVDKILRGTKPSDLPIEQAAKFQLVINLKTAKTLGLTVPPSLLDRADEVIE
jgi:putative tryptophan/tyrosine transport system substrate-binding protein